MSEKKKETLSDFYDKIQNDMLNGLSSANVKHNLEKGDATEKTWIKFFKRYLPNRYDVKKGIIIDSNGDQSPQIDIIIYDAQYSHFVFNYEDTFYIPAESVYAVFEVKPQLNQDNIEYAGNSASSVRKLYRTSAPIRHAGGEYPPKELHEIIAGLLTKSSDWKGKTKDTTEDNVVKYLNERTYYERLDLICSAENNTFSVNNNVFCKEYKPAVSYEIKFCNSDKTLIYLLLELLKKLQDIGTVPAIDFFAYEKPIKTKKQFP